MRFSSFMTASLTAALLAAAPLASAQTTDRRVITLDGAKAILAAAEAEAVKNKWTVAIAVVDESGNLIAFHRIDDTQVGSIDIALGKGHGQGNHALRHNFSLTQLSANSFYPNAIALKAHRPSQPCQRFWESHRPDGSIFKICNSFRYRLL